LVAPVTVTVGLISVLDDTATAAQPEIVLPCAVNATVPVGSAPDPVIVAVSVTACPTLAPPDGDTARLTVGVSGAPVS
jgi:hypothetical protein